MENEPVEKPLFWIKTEIAVPPLTTESKRQAGYLIRLLQRGESIGMPNSRPMSSVGLNVHELRLSDETGREWRIFYRIDSDAIVLAGLFPKTTRATPRWVIDRVKQRLADYDAAKKPTRPPGKRKRP